MTCLRLSSAFVCLGALIACAATGPSAAQDGSARPGDGPLPNVVMFEFTTKTQGRTAEDGASGARRSQQGARPAASRRPTGERATRGSAGTDPVSVADVIARADEPHLARLVLRDPPGEPVSVEGTLLFGDVDALVTWRRTRMADFLQPMGGARAIETTIRVVNRDLLGEYGLGNRASNLENLQVTYTNTGNTADGDADIDAVTVVCPGDFANCSPSN